MPPDIIKTGIFYLTIFKHLNIPPHHVLHLIVQSFGSPLGSWNIEDVTLYKGIESKRNAPTK